MYICTDCKGTVGNQIAGYQAFKCTWCEGELVIKQETSDADPDYTECDYWIRRAQAFDPSMIKGHKCGRCDTCCDEGDAILLARKEGD